MSASRARVLIVDDHPLVREGLAARISSQPDLEVCGQAADADEALRLLRSADPDLLIVDLALKGSNGLALIRQASRVAPQVRSLVVSAYDERLFAERALRFGAHGYVNKQEAQGTVIEAIRTVLAGRRYLSAEMAQRLIGAAVGGTPERSGVDGLTDREFEIFELIGRGEGTRQIAEKLHISVHTVESHRENIRAKLGLRSGTELVQSAVRWLLEAT